MFKKPKRSLRTRQHDSDVEDDILNESLSLDSVNSNNSLHPFVKKTTTNGNKAVKDTASKKVQLSFQIDDEDEGEEFKVKKSSHSRKIAMQLKQENLKEKETKDIGIKYERKEISEKKTQSVPPKKITESQKAAEQIEMEIGSEGSEDDRSRSSDDSDEDRSSTRRKDASKVSMRKLLESGQIPDSNIIHMVRKQREMARLKGSEDFIPIDDTVRAKSNAGRLIREDDEDLSDDEEKRWNFSQVKNQREQELRLMNSTILAAEHGSDGDGSDQEANAWEEQQIRKGVSIPALQVNTAQSLSQSASSQQMAEYPSYNDFMTASYYMMMPQQMYGISPASSSSSLARPSLPPTHLPQITIDDIVMKLQQRLEEMETVHRAHDREYEDINSRAESSQTSIETLSRDISGLEERYQFFQEMRGYVRDLIECFAEKVVSINYLERCYDKLQLQRTEKLAKRRQEDVKDQAQDYVPGKAVVVIPPAESEMKQRRAAEREARRTRRRRAREGTPAATDHQEGMSTDDEENKSEMVKLAAEQERILNDSRTVFEDVVEDFADPELISRRFARWRREYGDSYAEAYISLCVSKLVVPLVRLSLIGWNPLQESCEDIEQMTWFRALVRYSSESRTLQQDAVKDDTKILPAIIEKVLLPKLIVVVEKMWNVTSLKETKRLVALVRRVVTDYPTVTTDSKPTQNLLKAIIQVLRKALDDELFIPMYPREVIENKTTGAGAFFHRRFWTAVKLMTIVLQWRDTLSPRLVQEMALDRILNRYLVLALQNSPVNQDSLIKCQAIVDVLPEDWFSGERTITQLEPLCRYLVFAASTLDKSSANTVSKETIRLFVKSVIRMLTVIHAMDHAQNLAKLYSIKF